MESERADMGYKRWKDNEMKFMNPQSLSGMRHGITDGDIPEWLLVEVLVRLSTKLVCRFKLVSKQWLSIISDPSFGRTYVSRASLLSQPWTFISNVMHHKGDKHSPFPEFMLLDDVCSQLVKPSYCVLPLPCTQQSHDGEHYLINAVSNGFVLYCLSLPNESSPCSYYICNPVTRLWIALPAVTSWFSKRGCGFLTHVEDGVLKSYKVVLLELSRRNFVNFKVFFSEIGEWNTFTVHSDLKAYQCFWSIFRMNATAINGVLHWMSDKIGIIAYDPCQSPEQMHIIAFPDDRNDDGGQSVYTSLCAEYKGKLRYFELDGNDIPSFKLWVLDDYISGGWSLQHDISYMDIQFDISYKDIQYDANIPFDTSFLQPISFHPFDLDVVYFGFGDALVSYNIKTKQLEVQQKCYRQNGITPEQSTEWWTALLLVIPSKAISSCFSSGGAKV